MLHKLSTMMNIQAGEGRLVILLLAQSFCLGLAKIFTSTAASALFITQFGAHRLPYVYIGLAIVVSLMGYLYAQLERRISFKLLLIVNLSVLLLTLVAFRLLLGLTNATWPIMALIIWLDVVTVLSGLAFWGLAGHLLDLRQGKRLFGLVGSGDMAASIISGLAMPALVGLMGTPNLLLVAAAGMAGALLLFLYVIRLYNSQLSTATKDKQTVYDNPSEKSKSQVSYLEMFKNRYTGLVFALAAVASFGFFFVDNAFYDMIQIRYTNANQMAAFLGRFLALANMVSLIGRVFITGPFLNRYGLLGGMLSLSLPVAIGTLLIVMLGPIFGAVTLIFWLTTATKLFDNASRFSIYNSTEQILYQPLAPKQRSQALTIVESLIGPLAGGMAGLILLFLINVLGFGAIQLYYIVFIILIGWFALIFLLNKEYAVALTQCLTRRHLPQKYLALSDGASLSVLQKGLNSTYAGEVIYTLNILEEIKPADLNEYLQRALIHPAPEVRYEVLLRFEQRRDSSVLGDIRQLIEIEPVVMVRARALQTLAALGDVDVIEEVQPYLNHPIPQIKQGALVGLLRSGGIEGVLVAGQQLLELANSSDPTKRLFAAQVLGEIGISNFHRPLLPLLQDEDITVRQAALTAAGKLKSPQLWPLVIEALSVPLLSTVATSALTAGGQTVVPELRATLAQPEQSPHVLIQLIRVCGRIRGKQVIALLQDKLDYPDEAVRSQVFTALNRCGYQAQLNQDVALINKLIKGELTDVTWTLVALADIGEDEAVKHLKKALHNELDRNRTHLFLLLSFIYDSESILKARDTLRMTQASAEKRAYALEIIEVLIPLELKQILLPLFDESISRNHWLEKLIAVFPQKRLKDRPRLIDIISQSKEWVDSWVVACALDAVARLSITEAKSAIIDALSDTSPLIRETAIRALLNLIGHEAWQYIDPLIHDSHPQIAQTAQYLKIAINGVQATMLSMIEKVLILKTVNIFAETPEVVLAEMALSMEEMSIKMGQTLFEKGDPGQDMYIIFLGRVRVHDGQQTLAELGSRKVFGEMELLDSQPRSASITALEETHLLRLNRDHIFEIMADQHEVAKGIIQALSLRIRLLNEKVISLSKQISAD